MSDLPNDPTPEEMIRVLYHGFMVAPEGSKEPPLIERTRQVVDAYEKAAWITRHTLKGVPLLAAFAAGVLYLKGLWIGETPK